MKISTRCTGRLLALPLLLALVGSSEAQTAGGAADDAPCSSAEHRQFDFWLGEWDVFVDGEKAGENTIRRAVGGCVIHESYRAGGSAYEGQSFNIYDRRRRVWHQTWVDNGGLLLQLDGGFEDGSMRLEGTVRGPDGEDALHRITWSPMEEREEHRVRQLWERSTDGGRSWEVVFDGTYRRAAGPAR